MSYPNERSLRGKGLCGAFLFGSTIGVADAASRQRDSGDHRQVHCMQLVGCRGDDRRWGLAVED